MSLLLPITHGSAIDSFLNDIITPPNEPKQKFITKLDMIQIQTDDKLVVHTILITDRNYYEFRVDDPITGHPIPISQTSLMKAKPLTDIHSIEIVRGQPRQFIMHFFSGSVADKTKRQFSRMKRLIQSSTLTQSFITKSKLFTCPTSFNTIQFIFLLQRLIRNLWQQTFESRFIPAPEIYQRHCFVIKKSADRILLISTRWMYNIAVTYKPTLVKDLKWAIPLATLTLITINTDDIHPSATTLFDEYEANKLQDVQHSGAKNKTGFTKHKREHTRTTSMNIDTDHLSTETSHVWIFRTVHERNKTVTLLVRVHLELTGKQLQVEVEPDKRAKPSGGPAFLQEIQLRNETGATLKPSKLKTEKMDLPDEVLSTQGMEGNKVGKDKEKCVLA